MKKLSVFLTAAILLLSTVPVLAAWEVTASWTASIGPNLEKEELVVGTDIVFTVTAGEPTAHIFTLPELSGQIVKIISYNTAGVPNDGYVMGTLDPIAAPADATGGSIIIRWKP